MLIDANTIEAREPLRAKFCIVGSGMGGSALANALARARAEVLLVEAGNTELSEGREPSVRSEQVGRSFNMPLTRCIELGGTSNQWHGICAPLDEMDFAERPWIAGSGWPITRATLQPHYLEAAALLGLPTAGWFDSEPLPPALAERLRDLEFDRATLQPKIVYNRKPPWRWKPKLLELAHAGTLRCLMNATALELVGEGGSAIRELLVGTARGKLSIQADVFIVCCGGLETPRLLLNSRRAQPNGLGNGRDLVGRNLIDHPAGHFNKLRFQRTTAAPLFSGLPANEHAGVIAGLMLTPEKQREARLPNHYVWVRPSVSAARIDDELMLSFLKVRGVRDLSLRQIFAILSNRDILYRVLVHRFGIRPSYRFGDLWFMTEQLPNPDSRVRLSVSSKDSYGYPVASIDWRLSADDLAQFHAYAAQLFGSGLRSDQYELARKDDPEIWSRTVASAAHHLGTARMGHDVARGVVDPDLKVFGVPNLYVCDASVFPTAGSVNPSLTITALGLRLARHLLAARAA
ncbi:MAG: GMC family oxidoreductase [Gammaproteobacteria bacterium]